MNIFRKFDLGIDMARSLLSVISYLVSWRHGMETIPPWRQQTWTNVDLSSARPSALRWRHNEPDRVSNHQPRDCLLNGLFRRRSKKTRKLRVTGLCAGNSPGIIFSAKLPNTSCKIAYSHYFRDVPWASLRLKQIIGNSTFFNCVLGLTTTKISKVCITGTLW